MRISALHHVEMCVKNGSKHVSYFTDKLGFSLRALRDTVLSRQWVLSSRKSNFVITERKDVAINDSREQALPFTYFCCPDKHHVDSVFNVAIEVKDVDLATASMQKFGAKVYHPVSDVEDQCGVVRYSIVGSCCGNIVHTLLDKSRYTGTFLPTFATPPNSVVNNEEPFTHIDHVTYVCRPGESADIIRWYADCLGMKKFRVNPTEDPVEGLVIGDGIGMRLRVMDYWPCAESGVSSNPDSDGLDESSLKIVIAESLPERENPHIGAFLSGHGGPGLQHIGLHSSSIARCVDRLASNGIHFRKPPAAYYENAKKAAEIVTAGYEVEELQPLGILVDSEADVRNDSQDRFLLQIFTLPLFDEETFFLEVVQRQGARGFGAGNVTALARSIEEERQKQLKRQRTESN